MFKDIHEAVPGNAENDILERDLSLGLHFFVLSQAPIEQLHDTNIAYCVLLVNRRESLPKAISRIRFERLNSPGASRNYGK